MSHAYNPILFITIGDIGGVGPEIVFKSLEKSRKNNTSSPCVIYVPDCVVEYPYYGSYIKQYPVVDSYEEAMATIERPYPVVLLEVPTSITTFTKNKPDGPNGRLSYDMVCRAIKDVVTTQKTRPAALVTAPICKESLHLAGAKETGHTSILANQTQSRNVSMCFYTPRLKTVLVTIHHALSRVPDLITETTLTIAIDNAFTFAKYLGLTQPKIAIAGLNPHASEGGLFGCEEAEVITPVVESYTQKGMPVIGPLSADTLYYRAYHGEFDIVVSMYHDQGLIPIKLIGFDDAVNVSIGLPFIRTSPDHGTAFDIAYTGKAKTTSFEAAMELAVTLSKHHGT